jgi:hypothetical protein
MSIAAESVDVIERSQTNYQLMLLPRRGGDASNDETFRLI